MILGERKVLCHSTFYRSTTSLGSEFFRPLAVHNRLVFPQPAQPGFHFLNRENRNAAPH